MTNTMQEKNQDHDTTVQITNDPDASDVDPAPLKALVNALCRRFNLPKTTVSVAIVGDAEIRELNNKFLKRDSTTDCLSFDLSDDDASQKTFELIVNAEMAARQASRRGHSSQAEIALYVTHAMLHNLGFDDAEESKAKIMHDMEDEILQQHGYGPVYSSEPGAGAAETESETD